MLFTINVSKPDKSVLTQNVLANDTATDPAVVVAIRQALAKGGAGSEVIFVNKMNIDIDATKA